MDLRAFHHTSKILAMASFLVAGSSLAAKPKAPPVENIPYEIKFADITFQLSDVTRYLVQTEVDALQANRRGIQEKLDKFSTFLPSTENILKENNIPVDFKFLMIYDKYQATKDLSVNLEPAIYWCLNEEKAADVDLKINSLLDERKHIVLATRGAALCLKRNYILYNNWATVLFSHIADKKVLQALEVNRKWGNTTIIQLDSPVYAPILQFLAYRIAIEREFPAFRPPVPKVLYEYPYGKGKTLQKISEELKVDLPTLTENNQWFSGNLVPDEEGKVIVVTPADRFNQTRTLAELTQKSGLPTKDLGFPLLKRNMAFAKERGGVFYEINGKIGLQAEMCDNAVTMAYKGEMSIKKFLELNDMNEKDLLRVGWVYYLEKKNSKATVPYHVVREGETLWDISQMYGVQLPDLLANNRLEKVQRLQRGRIVWMQATRPKNKPIEYIQMPEELPLNEVADNEKEAIQPVAETKLQQIEVSKEEPKIEQNIAKTDEKGVLPKEIDINSLPLTHEIGKEPNKNVASSAKQLPKEVDVNSLPLTHEIGKDLAKNSAAKSKENTKEKPKEKPKEQPKISDKDGWGDVKSITIGEAKTKIKKSENNYSEDVAKRVAQQTSSNESVGKFVYHVVKKDETLYRISVNYSVSVENLWKLNNLSSNIIEIGTKLKVKKE